MSVAGGLPCAVERARLHGCDALQIFTKNASRWQGRSLPPGEISAFLRAVTDARLATVVSHASYLINLAAADPDLRRRSIDAMAEELDRAEVLRLLGVVLHPGCYTSGNERDGLQRIADGIAALLASRPDARTMILLEHTAGQGTSLGASFEQLAIIIDILGGHPRIGVCLDTCHLLAAGYDIATAEGYAETFRRFESTIGLSRLKIFHVNDSKKPLGSKVDRHEGIGRGHVGIEAFRRLVNDPRFQAIPMILETPKAAGKKTAPIAVDALDARNLHLLRALVAGSRTIGA